MAALNDVSMFTNLWVLALILLPIYHTSRNVTIRKSILLLLGALLLFYVAPRLVLLYALFWVMVLAMQRVVLATRHEANAATRVMLALVGLILVPMVSWKVFPDWFTVETALAGNAAVTHFATPLGWLDANRSTLLPVGLSFATFRVLDLLLQTSLEQIDRPSALDVIAYGFCPFLLAVGSIATLQEVDHSRTATSLDVKYGLYRILSGLVKIFVLAAMIEPWSGVFHATGSRPGYQIIAALYVFAVYFYLNFSGYSDLAIGTGRLFGMVLPENFRWPLLRQNPQQYWANWHASLSRFALRYIFPAAGGMRKGGDYKALLATMMTIAWWHELNGPWTVFGLYHGLGLIVHRWWTRNRPTQLEAAKDSLWYRALTWFLLFNFVAFGFPIISLPLDSLVVFYCGLFRW
jgi:D-alanyl-lipoteichoic acid acyltransferase DltB (MBOAT superfamily)